MILEMRSFHVRWWYVSSLLSSFLAWMLVDARRGASNTWLPTSTIVTDSLQMRNQLDYTSQILCRSSRMARTDFALRENFIANYRSNIPRCCEHTSEVLVCEFDQALDIHGVCVCVMKTEPAQQSDELSLVVSVWPKSLVSVWPKSGTAYMRVWVGPAVSLRAGSAAAGVALGFAAFAQASSRRGRAVEEAAHAKLFPRGRGRCVAAHKTAVRGPRRLLLLRFRCGIQ